MAQVTTFRRPIFRFPTMRDRLIPYHDRAVWWSQCRPPAFYANPGEQSTGSHSDLMNFNINLTALPSSAVRHVHRNIDDSSPGDLIFGNERCAMNRLFQTAIRLLAGAFYVLTMTAGWHGPDRAAADQRTRESFQGPCGIRE